MSDSTIIREAGLNDPFARVPKSLLDDPRISWRAKGVLAYLIGKPAGWKVRVGDIVKRGKEGRDAVWSALNELRAFGYASFEFARDAGKFQAGVWRVCDRPIFGPSPYPEKPDTVKPDTVFPYVSKKELTKKDSKKKESSAATALPQDLRLAIAPHSARPPKDGPSPEALADADSFREKLLAKDFSPGAGWRIAWARALDKLVAEGRDLDEIWEVCKWARKDEFWSAHFHVPTELLRRRSGVLVFDRLRSAMNAGKRQPSEPKL